MSCSSMFDCHDHSKPFCEGGVCMSLEDVHVRSMKIFFTILAIIAIIFVLCCIFSYCRRKRRLNDRPVMAGGAIVIPPPQTLAPTTPMSPYSQQPTYTQYGTTTMPPPVNPYYQEPYMRQPSMSDLPPPYEDVVEK